MRTGGVALVWGPPRSGTTWLYNVVRDMLRAADVSHAGWVHGHRPPTSSGPTALVVKSHQAHSMDVIESLGSTDHVYLIAMFRSPTSAFQSLLRTQTADRAELLRWLVRDVDSIEKALPRLPNAVVCREEWIEHQSLAVVQSLAAWLDIPLDIGQCAQISRTYSRDQVRSSVSQLAEKAGWSYDFRHFDPDSHWHANHIAPDDHRPERLTGAEREQLGSLRVRIESMTARQSVLNSTPHGHDRAGGASVSEAFLAASMPPEKASTRRSRALERFRSLAS